MEIADHGVTGAERRQPHIGDLELAGGHALRDHAADGLGDQLHMGDADVPALLHRDLDHLMQLGIADIAFRVHAIDGLDHLAQPLRRRARLLHDHGCRFLDLAHQGAADALMDRLLGIEEAVDVGRRHPQFLGDVGDRGLRIAELAEQTLRHHENPFSCVRLDMFGNQRHGVLHCSIIRLLQQAEMRALPDRNAAAQDRPLRLRLSRPGSCGTIARRGPAGTARSGRLQQTIRP